MPYNWNYYNRQKKSDYRNNRPDHQPGQRGEFERNRKKIIASQDICAICGQPVNKKLKYPDPLSATVDHIIPIARGGHPSDLSNLQLAHLRCNIQKSDSIRDFLINTGEQSQAILPKHGLPWSIDWTRFKATGENNNVAALLEEAERIRQNGHTITARGIV